MLVRSVKDYMSICFGFYVPISAHAHLSPTAKCPCKWSEKWNHSIPNDYLRNVCISTYPYKHAFL